MWIKFDENDIAVSVHKRSIEDHMSSKKRLVSFGYVPTIFASHNPANQGEVWVNWRFEHVSSDTIIKIDNGTRFYGKGFIITQFVNGQWVDRERPSSDDLQNSVTQCK